MPPDRPAAAPGAVARQNALDARAAALDATGVHYAPFHLACVPAADLDALEVALDATGRYRAELREAAAELRADPRAGPATTDAAPLSGAASTSETPATTTRREPSSASVAPGGDRAGAPKSGA